ncbi:MAG: ribosome-associated translation inhibitor RaiA [Candidatus Caldatribacteriota bacterium]|jgi:putative sigma-54 modulation protein|nr:ribosome-associated translation inhibitor RaiA [Atribacterota bacterium]MDD3030928.1 ribosome-associated translation inhibitor RaiA [Atribacterota bacterium]MDD3640457.1 ribosome-associated translation inhibitor RaiA [Atribacterota bacterium]MDD4288601.1 ribosome-associated translation inhibitor RaiA [Atribacterota bacterium]MDD4764796.1 ribosome-associated translation inhibitor RaiA [Atribacterota bacterium]
MKLTIKSRNFEVTDTVEEYVKKKMEKLNKYFDQIMDATAMVSAEKNRQIFEVTLQAKKAIIRAEEESNNIYTSIDRVVEKLERQIKKYKSKLYSKSIGEQNKSMDAQLLQDKKDEVASIEDEDIKIVKTKKFVIKPMTSEEASLQMELLGHNFFVFNNEATDQINVIYKRKDGNFGLIEPEV